MGFWIKASNDGDFIGSSVAPLSDELDDSPRLLGLICPVHSLGDGQFDGCPHCSGTVQRCAFLRSGSGRPVPVSPTS